MIQTMTSEEYHRPFSEFPYLGSTQIKQAGNLAKFKAMVLDGQRKKEKKKSFDLGLSAHSLILEQDGSRFVVGPDMNKNSIAWKDFAKENEGKIILDQEQHSDLLGMAKVFSEHKDAMDMLSKSQVEKTILWQDQSSLMQFKAKPDGFFEDVRGVVLWDYKTSRCADAESVSKDILNYGYDISMAHYKFAIENELSRRVIDVRLVVQETVFPYLIKIYRLSDNARARGESERTRLINRISVAIEENSFPGYGLAIDEIDLPSYAYSRDHRNEWGVA